MPTEIGILVLAEMNDEEGKGMTQTERMGQRKILVEEIMGQ